MRAVMHAFCSIASRRPARGAVAAVATAANGGREELSL